VGFPFPVWIMGSRVGIQFILEHHLEVETDFAITTMKQKGLSLLMCTVKSRLVTVQMGLGYTDSTGENQVHLRNHVTNSLYKA